MIPPVPTSVNLRMPTPKQKIGFSIDSIVGNDASPSTNGHQISMKSDTQTRSDIHEIINRLQTSNSFSEHLSKLNYSPPPSQASISPVESMQIKRERSPVLPLQHQNHQQNFSFNKGPLVVPGMPPGLVRPFPMGHPDIKALPAYINTPDMVQVPPQHNPHLLAAAQFQMAAALQAGHVLNPNMGIPAHSPYLTNSGIPGRDSYPLYPWLLNRHGRIFTPRFPGNFLLQPFRKPKRVRTAFSPSQLLKLEHAFENNHYVVGAERKTLAQTLNLTETQVKVWFQNRRTKHKRMQQEEDSRNGGSGNGGGNDPEHRNVRNNIEDSFEDDDEDELIDMDDCISDQEGE